MSTPTFVALLSLSSVLRLLWERLPVIAAADIAVVVLFSIWRIHWLLSWILVSLSFLIVAYFDTFLEYRDISNNLREEQALEDKLSSKIPLDEAEPLSSNNLHGKLRMFPCILRHIRRRAFKDDFAHSYLYIGVPVGLSACYSPLISVDHPSWNAVMSIRAHDQLIRGGFHLSLKQKLLEFLADLEEDPSQWTSAYFVTSPCVLGMHNNPLAYVYLYNAQKKLDAVILQLDTSYGERRLWIRRNEQEPDRQKGPFCFRAKYDKDLQVSPFMPFNDTSFVLDSNDPCATEDPSVHLVVTMSQGTTPFMVTSVTPNGTPLDVQTSSLWDRLRFLWHWAWLCTPTAVVWRILSMAASIFVYNRKSIVLNERPEPIKTATPKHARTIEKNLERYFVQILQAAVDNQSRIATVKYVTPGEHCPRTRIISSRNSSRSSEKAELPEVTFTVTTPPFYSRFFHYESPRSALVGELLNDERTRSSWCSHPEEFAALFNDFTSDMNPPTWRWRLVTTLRCPPNPTTHPKDPPWEAFEGLSANDCWVLQNCAPKDAEEYRRALLKTYLSERFGGVAIGPVIVYTEIFGLSRDGVLRIYEAWFKALMFMMAAYTARYSTSPRLDIGLLSAIGVNLWACFKALL